MYQMLTKDGHVCKNTDGLPVFIQSDQPEQLSMARDVGCEWVEVSKEEAEFFFDRAFLHMYAWRYKQYGREITA